MLGLWRCRAEAGDELVFGDDGDAQLLGFLVLSGGGGDIVVDEVGCALADATSDLAALRLDVCLQFVAVLIVMDVARDDEGESLAGVAFGL